MVEIFKTNVRGKRQALSLLKTLHANLPAYNFNFDLDDCDRILRVQTPGYPIEILRILQIVKGQSIEVSILED